MSRLTISLPDDMAAKVSREARRLGTSVSDLVRRALAARLGEPQAGRKLPFIAVGHSGGKGAIARNMEEILAREWRPDRRR